MTYGIRTRALRDHNAALYQTELQPPWCSRPESNRHPSGFQADALPTELREHVPVAALPGRQKPTGSRLGNREGDDLFRDRPIPPFQGAWVSLCDFKGQSQPELLGVYDWTRTSDLRGFRPMLFQLSYADLGCTRGVEPPSLRTQRIALPLSYAQHVKLYCQASRPVEEMGFEPTTFCLQSRCSTPELHPRVNRSALHLRERVQLRLECVMNPTVSAPACAVKAMPATAANTTAVPCVRVLEAKVEDMSVTLTHPVDILQGFSRFVRRNCDQARSRRHPHG